MSVEMQYSHAVDSRFELHTLNLLGAPVMKPAPGRRFENIVEPIPPRFLISRTFFFLSGNLVKERHKRKTESPKRCKCIAKDLLAPGFFESRWLSVDRRTRVCSQSVNDG